MTSVLSGCVGKNDTIQGLQSTAVVSPPQIYGRRFAGSCRYSSLSAMTADPVISQRTPVWRLRVIDIMMSTLRVPGVRSIENLWNWMPPWQGRICLQNSFPLQSGSL